jgi:hypothetical protein
MGALLSLEKTEVFAVCCFVIIIILIIIIVHFEGENSVKTLVNPLRNYSDPNQGGR